MGWVSIEQAKRKDTPDYLETFTESGPVRDYMMSGALQLDKYMRGAQNIYAKATDNQALQDELQAAQESADQTLDVISTRSPVASGAGTMAPALSTMALPGGLLAQTGYGAATSGLEYGDDQAAAATFGGLLSMGGGMAGKGIAQAVGKGKNVIKAARTALKGEAARLAARADELGMVVSPGNLQNSLPLKQLESSMRSNPATSGVVEPMIENNQRILNKLAINAIGESGDEVSGSVFAKAADRIGAVYERVANELGDDVIKVSGLANVADDMSTDTLEYLAKYEKRFPTLQEGYLTGKQFNALRQMVEKDIRNAWRNLPASAEDLQAFGSKLLDSVEDALPGYGDELRTAGRQWRNLKALEAGKVVTKGNVNARSLDTQLRRLDKGGYLRNRVAGPDSGLGDYYDAVRVATQFGEVVGDSGTATRSYLGLMFSDPKAAAAGAVLRPITRQYFESGGSPLYSGLLGVVPSSPAAGQAGAGIMRGYGVNK